MRLVLLITMVTVAVATSRLPVGVPIALPVFTDTPKFLSIAGDLVGMTLFNAINEAYVYSTDVVSTFYTPVSSATDALAGYGYNLFDLVILPSRLGPPQSADDSPWSQLPIAAYAFVVTLPTGLMATNSTSNKSGAGNTTLILDRATLASIWTGAIARWNHSAIARLNPTVALPDWPIVLVVGAHNSTSDEYASLTGVFGRALASLDPVTFAPAYAANNGSLARTLTALMELRGSASRLLVVSFGSSPNDSSNSSSSSSGGSASPLAYATLIQTAAATMGASTYAIYATALAGNVSCASLVNRANATIAVPTAASVTSAMVDYEAFLEGGSLATPVDGPGNGSWPLVGLAYGVMATNGTRADCTFADSVLGLLAWLQLNDGGSQVMSDNGLVPLTNGLRRATVDSIGTVTCNGQPGISAAIFIGSGSPLPQWQDWAESYDPQGTLFRLKYFETDAATAQSQVANYDVDFAGVAMPAVPLDSSNSNGGAGGGASASDLRIIPVGAHALVMAYNVPEIPYSAPPLVMTLDVMAAVYLGTISLWNDTRIVSLNPALASYLPGSPINVVLNMGDSSSSSSGSSGSGQGNEYGEATSATSGPLGGVPNQVLANMLSVVPGFAVAVFRLGNITYPVQTRDPGRVLLAPRDTMPAVMSTTTHSMGCYDFSQMSAARSLRFMTIVNMYGGTVVPGSRSFMAALNGTRSISASGILVNAPGTDSWPMMQWDFVELHASPAVPSTISTTTTTTAMTAAVSGPSGSASQCRKVTALLDWIYWTQTSTAAATIAGFDGAAVAGQVSWLLPYVLALLAQVNCSSSGDPAFSLYPCISWMPSNATTMPVAAQLCSGHGICRGPLAAPSTPGSLPSTAAKGARAMSSATAMCTCRAGWEGLQCQTPIASPSPSPSANAVAVMSGGGGTDTTGIIIGATLGGVAVLVFVCAALVVSATGTSIVVAVRRRRSVHHEWEANASELEIGDLIGTGGYGRVHRAVWRGTEVAVKTLPADRMMRSAVRNFKDEINVMMRLRHPNIVLFMGACTKPPHLCIIMEFMGLGSLYEFLNNNHVDHIPFQMKVKMASQAATGMHFLHSSGIVHRDLKSLNVLIDTKWNVKISDFGLTRFIDAGSRGSSNSSTGTSGADGDSNVDRDYDDSGSGSGNHPNHRPRSNRRHRARVHTGFGTVQWAAPEVLDSDIGEIDYKMADVYSFGVILWEILTRRVPYHGQSPTAVMVSVMRDDMRPTFEGAFQPERCLGAHEAAFMGTAADDFAALAQACWQRDPCMRPPFVHIMTRLDAIYACAPRNGRSIPREAEDTDARSGSHPTVTPSRSLSEPPGDGAHPSPRTQPALDAPLVIDQETTAPMRPTLGRYDKVLAALAVDSRPMGLRSVAAAADMSTRSLCGSSVQLLRALSTPDNRTSSVTQWTRSTTSTTMLTASAERPPLVLRLPLATNDSDVDSPDRHPSPSPPSRWSSMSGGHGSLGDHTDSPTQAPLAERETATLPVGRRWWSPFRKDAAAPSFPMHAQQQQQQQQQWQRRSRQQQQEQRCQPDDARGKQAHVRELGHMATADARLVVLVVTDIPSANILWTRVPRAMPDTIALHNGLLRTLSSVCGGHEVSLDVPFGAERDGTLCMAFPQPADAARWCAAVQQGLLQIEWPAQLLEDPLACAEWDEHRLLHRGPRVRMSIDMDHETALRDNSRRLHRTRYGGPAARGAVGLLVRAHPGQVLVSARVVRALYEADHHRRRRHAQDCPNAVAARETPMGHNAVTIRTRLDQPLRAKTSESRPDRRWDHVLTALPMRAPDVDELCGDGPEHMQGDFIVVHASCDRDCHAVPEAVRKRDKGKAIAHRVSADEAKDHPMDALSDGCILQICPLGLVARAFPPLLPSLLDHRGGGDDDDDDAHGTAHRLQQQQQGGKAPAENAFMSRESALPLAAYFAPYGKTNVDQSVGLHLIASANMCPWNIDERDVTLTGAQRERGTYGTVHQAQWRGIDVAVKQLTQQHLSETVANEVRGRMEQLCRLRHPNVVLLLGADLRAPRPFLVSEWVSGTNMDRLLDRTAPDALKLNKMQRLSLLYGAALGLSHLHGQTPPVVHGDLKPSDLLIEDTHTGMVKVSDFGMSCIRNESAVVTRCTAPCWTAPEVLQGHACDERADVYAFGVIMWQAWARRDPYAGTSFTRIVSDVLEGSRPKIPNDCPPAFAQLLRACWDGAPERRPTMDHVVDSLAALLDLMGETIADV